MNLRVITLINVVELLKIQTRMIVCWYLNMLKMEICITIYQKTLKKLLGKIKSVHFITFHKGKFIFIIRFISSLFNKHLVIMIYYIFNYKRIRLRMIHEKNYIHHDLHSGNIFSYAIYDNRIGDLGLCQQVVDKKDNLNKIIGVIPYL